MLLPQSPTNATRLPAMGAPSGLLDREHVAEHLHRVAVVGQRVDDGDGRRRHLEQARGRRRAVDDRVAVAGEDARRVANGLAAPELAALHAEHHRVHPELRAADLERDTRARARLLEHDGDRPPGAGGRCACPSARA